MLDESLEVIPGFSLLICYLSVFDGQFQISLLLIPIFWYFLSSIMPFFKEKVNLNISFYCANWVFSWHPFEEQLHNRFFKGSITTESLFHLFFFSSSHCTQPEWQLWAARKEDFLELYYSSQSRKAGEGKHFTSFKFSYLPLYDICKTSGEYFKVQTLRYKIHMKFPVWVVVSGCRPVFHFIYWANYCFC